MFALTVLEKLGIAWIGAALALSLLIDERGKPRLKGALARTAYLTLGMSALAFILILAILLLP